MKKKLHFLLMMMLSLCMTFVCAQEVPFHVRFSTGVASCYNNGTIVFALTDSDGTVLDSLPDGLSLVRIYHRSAPDDTIRYSGRYYSGGFDTLTMNSGTYLVGVEGLWYDGNGGYMRVDTQTVIEVTTTYIKPEASVLPLAASRISDAGNLPSLVCQNTGRVQLMMANGKFPYTVTVCDPATGDTLRSCVFHNYQYQGLDGTKAAYKYYYTFDTMPSGAWDFYVVDGCGYGLPRISHEVPTSHLPRLESIRLYASSGNFADTNVVKIGAVMDKNPGQFGQYIPQFASYRLVYEGLETKEWRPYPAVNGVTYTIYDTVYAAEKYCDIWDHQIYFEYKTEGCENWSGRVGFQLKKPDEEYFEKDTFNLSIGASVGGTPCNRIKEWRRDYYSIRYYSSLTANGKVYDPDYFLYIRFPNNTRDVDYYRYRYTHPLTWVYTDARTGNVIKMDTIRNITNFSFLRYEEVEAIYGSLQDTVLEIPVTRRLLDRKGCELYSTLDTMTFFHCRGSVKKIWTIMQSGDDNVCCRKIASITLSDVSEEFDIDPTWIRLRLVQSPDHNRYNFVADYNPVEENWTIIKENVDNPAMLEGTYDGRSFSLKDYCLLSGPYRFILETPCDTLQLGINASFPGYYKVDWIEEPAYSLARDCGNLYLAYTAGRYVKTTYSRSASVDWEDTVSTVNEARIQIVSAPHSSYTNLEGFGLNAPLLVNMPGRYVFEVGTKLDIGNSCMSRFVRDTVDISVNTVEFEYAYALLCDTSDMSGNAYVKGVNGTEPYTYTLYSQPDRQGEVLGINHTGVFLDVPMRSDQELSCLVSDSCISYFHVNFYPRTLADLRKVWFDGGMTAHTDCEGSTIQVHALSISGALRYDWSGPDGFRAFTADPYVYIPRGGSSGWYKVSITYEPCEQVLMDSIYLNVWESPAIDIAVAPDTMVCPGDTMTVYFTPSTPVDTDVVTFVVAFSNRDGVTKRSYSAAPGQTVTNQFVAFTDTKVYPLRVADGRCVYTSADAADTAVVHVRTDMNPSCTLLTTYDTVCVGRDARLSAKSTLPAPYTIKWYGDYALSQLLKTDTLADEDRWSYYDTAGIIQRTVLYVAVETEGVCPTVNGLTRSTMNMQDGTTVVECGQAYRLYDAGGRDGGYPITTETVHRFRSADGRPLAIHFDGLSLARTAHLLIFTGEEMHPDSLLYDLQAGSWNPGVVISNGDALTLYFNGGKISASGWDAVVECAPGVAVADVWPKQETALADEVCQSQTRHYDDPYGVVPEIASAEELDMAIRKAGHYYFSKTYPDAGDHGCDSTVSFELFVNPPFFHDTTVIVTDLQGGSLQWCDSLYTRSGRYSVLRTRPDGCDSVEVLNLVVLNTDLYAENICRGDSTYMYVDVSGDGHNENNSLSPSLALIGNVLCTDGSILPPDSFALSGKTAKGVVFYADEAGVHGLAVALSESQLPMAVTMSAPLLLMTPSLVAAMSDMDGLSNTRRIRNAVNAVVNADFNLQAPAARYCYYFDHNTLQEGTLHTGWYMPSLGELNKLYVNRLAVNKTLMWMAGQDSRIRPLASSCYWSSTVLTNANAWVLTNAGNITSGTIGTAYCARPVITF